MMQTSRKKLVLEHIAVRKMGKSGATGGGADGAGGEGGGGSGGGRAGLKQSELDDILRYGGGTGAGFFPPLRCDLVTTP